MRMLYNTSFLGHVLYHCNAIFSPVSDECRICDQQLINLVKIHSDDTQKFYLGMKLPFREKHWIKFCMKFLRVIFLDNYYSQIYYCFYKYSNRVLTLLWQFFLIPNRRNKYGDLRI